MTDLRRIRRFQIVGLIVMLSTAVLAVACGSVDPLAVKGSGPGAEPKGRILFAQRGDIYMWDGEVSQITQFGDASMPSWSPDGSQFVFIRTGNAVSDLYVANADGSGIEQLTFNQPQLQPGTQAYVQQSVWALDPDWSPAGDDVVYVSDRGTTKNFLWLMQGIGTDPVQITASTSNGENVEDPSFSPDGTQIVFAQRTSGDSDVQRWTQIWTVDLNTGELTALVSGDQASYDPDWSPDGRWIVYVQRTGQANDLWVVPADGGQPVQLTNVGNAVSPTWSPDGSAIAFLQPEGTSFKVVYIAFTVGEDGVPRAGKPQDLFEADAIDAVSGLSWVP